MNALALKCFWCQRTECVCVTHHSDGSESSGLPGRPGYDVIPAGVGIDEPRAESHFPSLEEMARLLWDRPSGCDHEKARVLRMFAQVWANVEGVPAPKAMKAAEAIVDEMTMTAAEREAEARR